MRRMDMIIGIKRKVIDLFDSVYFKLNRLNIPPYSLRVHVGPIEEYGRLPQEYIAYFKLLCGLKMTETILDIGCGTGRFASELISSPNFFRGEYYGFDVHKKAIDWATKKITTHHRKFQFEFVDLWNGHYNPKGKLKASAFSFPYEDAKFDFVFAMSVFTHLLPKDTENYLRQINRILKPKGKALLTFLLLNGYPKTLSEIAQKRKHRKGGPIKWQHNDIYSIRYPDRPEVTIAYQESELKRMIVKSNLQLEKTFYGAWNKAEDYLSYQDIIIVHKKL